MNQNTILEKIGYYCGKLERLEEKARVKIVEGLLPGIPILYEGHRLNELVDNLVKNGDLSPEAGIASIGFYMVVGGIAWIKSSKYLAKKGWVVEMIKDADEYAENSWFGRALTEQKSELEKITSKFSPSSFSIGRERGKSSQEI